MALFCDPELLGPSHVLEGFDCGVPSLDQWLVNHARSAASAGSARTYVTVDCEQNRVVGYHSLTVASIEHNRATARTAKGMPGHSIPVALLARLAVDRSAQGRGLGAWLLKDAMIRTCTASEEVGIRAMLVHAKDETAKAFYLRFGFEPSPTDPLNLQMLVKDIRKTLGR